MANVSNSPTANENGQIPGIYAELYDESVDIFILPRWLCQAFQAKYNLVDILDFSKLRTVASLADIAHLEVLRSKLFERSMSVGNDGPEYYPLCSFLHGGFKKNKVILSEQNKREISSTISYLVEDPTVVSEALTRLKSQDELKNHGLDCEAVEVTVGNVPEEQVPYKVIFAGYALYIIVEEGFLSHIEEKAKRLAFLKQVLKSAYAIAPIPVVNNSVFYQQYLKALV